MFKRDMLNNACMETWKKIMLIVFPMNNILYLIKPEEEFNKWMKWCKNAKKKNEANCLVIWTLIHI
jgi:hypothetical protein